jgi:hypothetical protein
LANILNSTHSSNRRSRLATGASLLNLYEPNTTRWLSTELTDLLVKANEGFEGPRGRQSGAFIAPYRRLLISFQFDLAYWASRLEGIEISWLDTQALIDRGERPPGLSGPDTQAVLNLACAIKHICSRPRAIELSVASLVKVNRLLCLGLQSPSEASGGAGPSQEAPAGLAQTGDGQGLQEHSAELSLLCDTAVRIQDPFEQALFILGMVIQIQPFALANQTTALVCMNIPLLRASLLPHPFSHAIPQDFKAALQSLSEHGQTGPLAEIFAKAYSGAAPQYSEKLALMMEGGLTRRVM